MLKLPGSHGNGVAAALPLQWYASPYAAIGISAGSYRLRPSNTTGVRNAVRMASKSGVRNALHSVTMGSALAPRCASAAQAANN